ncbi:hypothetical protein PENSUB_1123 [Penicillium subrubescens]|uniref:Uncharacterized protein n=1 Tax=Penicillium subrubescens TaxID=1316194 RepID=A0A1Q5UKP6_9EURO|nr:hypothetical protein PENSUB_1123 [Penicillium subrubescens]
MVSARQSDSRSTSPRCTRDHSEGFLVWRQSRNAGAESVRRCHEKIVIGATPPPYNFSKLVDKLPPHVQAVMFYASSDGTK